MSKYESEIQEMAKAKINMYPELFKLIASLHSDASEGFNHTTALNNLFNIYKSGIIYSRNNAEEKNLIVCDNNKENDITNSCLQKTSDFYKTKARFYLKKVAPAIYKFNTEKCCTLICDYRILFDFDLDTYFSIGSFNDSKIYKVSTCYKELYNKMPFDYIYRNCNRYDYIDENIKHYNSSEFLCENGVPIKYIKKIVFKNEKDKEWFIYNLKGWVDDYNPELIVDNSYFRGEKYDYNN